MITEVRIPSYAAALAEGRRVQDEAIDETLKQIQTVVEGLWPNIPPGFAFNIPVSPNLQPHSMADIVTLVAGHGWVDAGFYKLATPGPAAGDLAPLFLTFRAPLT